MIKDLKFTKLLFSSLRSSERGIALIFTLGILGLLMVIALAFASGSITERKAAVSSDARSSARILAQAGLNRAVAAVMYYSSVSDSFDQIESHDETSTDNKQTYDYIYKLSTSVEGFKYEFPESYSATDSQAVHWQYVDNGLTGTKLALTGRYAYVVIPGGGCLDPSEVVDSGTGTLTLENVSTKERPGVNASEIYVRGLSTDTAFLLTDADLIGLSDSSLGGKKTPLTRWPDMSTIFSAAKLNITDITKQQRWGTWFNTTASPEPEAFWVDLNNDQKKDTATELFKRFNLSRTDWDTISVTDILADKVLYPGGSGTPGINWLRNFGLTDSGADDYTNTNVTGTFGTTALSVAKRRFQIAANLKDYCDTDSVPTSGVVTGAYTMTPMAPSTWSPTNVPDFTGNENTPYLNELGFCIYATYTDGGHVHGPDGSGNYTYLPTMKVYIQPGGELANIYGTNFSSPAKIKSITGTLNYTYQFSTGSSTSRSIAIDGSTLSVDMSLGNPGSSGYYPAATSFWQGAVQADLQGGVETGYLNAPPTCTFGSVTLQINSMILEYNGNNVDFASLPNTATPSLISTSVTIPTGSASPSTAYVSYQAKDPRQNLNSGDWNFNSGTVANTYASSAVDYKSASGAKGTPGAVNLGVNPSSGPDLETATDPASSGGTPTLSTAYIRNSPMQSPSELGLIHRGAAWETLNIHEYNTNRNTGLNQYAGGSIYTKSAANKSDGGDANILDQIKMEAFDQIYGKVNVKTASNDVLKALFFAVKYGSKPGDYPSSYGGAQIADSQADKLASACRTYISSNPFKTRAMIANAPRITSDTNDGQLTLGRTTKSSLEEILGKTVNLMKVGSADYFTVVVLAQTLKDVGGPYGTGITLNKDLNGDGTIATTSISNVDPGALTGTTRTNVLESKSCQLGVYDFGFDEILAEQKVIAVFKKNASGYWRIVRFEYVDPGADSW